MRRAALLLAAVLIFMHSCTAPGSRRAPAPEGLGASVVGDAIVVCGRRFRTGAPVVLWSDPGGYDAYRLERRFLEGGEPAARYGEREMPGDPADFEALRRHVDQFVIHYDAAGTSRQCFKVLHDLRGLSVHFMIDVDGTIYQTLDLRERAWHATKANGRSIGVEIAQIGAYPAGAGSPLDDWYARDEAGTYLTIPAWQGDGGVRTAGGVWRPARPGVIEGEIQGELLRQHDFTPQQYESLARLTASLCEVFPRLRCDYPRGPDGGVLPRVMDDRAYESYRGLLGHHHVQENKVDPGPAFDWEWVVGRARRLMRSAG